MSRARDLQPDPPSFEKRRGTGGWVNDQSYLHVEASIKIPKGWGSESFWVAENRGAGGLNPESMRVSCLPSIPHVMYLSTWLFIWSPYSVFYNKSLNVKETKHDSWNWPMGWSCDILLLQLLLSHCFVTVAFLISLHDVLEHFSSPVSATDDLFLSIFHSYKCCVFLLSGHESIHKSGRNTEGRFIKVRGLAGQSLRETTASSLCLVLTFIFSNQDVNCFGL